MNIKDILSDNTRKEPYVFNQDIYGNVYKKTEKIACAVFLITDNKEGKHIHEIVKDVRKAAQEAFRSATAFVSESDGGNAPTAIRDLMHLRGLLYMLVASRDVSADLIDVVAREIDAVVGALHGLSYGRGNVLSESVEYQPPYVHPTLRERAPLKAFGVPRRTAASRPVGETSSRREAILSVIRARGVVSIKDISDSITDCSEKTIQRELIGLVKDNVVVREGERRWSRYSVKHA